MEKLCNFPVNLKKTYSILRASDTVSSKKKYKKQNKNIENKIRRAQTRICQYKHDSTQTHKILKILNDNNMAMLSRKVVIDFKNKN